MLALLPHEGPRRTAGRNENITPSRVYRHVVCKVVCTVYRVGMHRPYGLHEVAGSRRRTPDCIPRPRTKRALRIRRARSVIVVGRFQQQHAVRNAICRRNDAERLIDDRSMPHRGHSSTNCLCD